MRYLLLLFAFPVFAQVPMQLPANDSTAGVSTRRLPLSLDHLNSRVLPEKYDWSRDIFRRKYLMEAVYPTHNQDVCGRELLRDNMAERLRNEIYQRED